MKTLEKRLQNLGYKHVDTQQGDSEFGEEVTFVNYKKPLDGYHITAIVEGNNKNTGFKFIHMEAHVDNFEPHLANTLTSRTGKVITQKEIKAFETQARYFNTRFKSK